MAVAVARKALEDAYLDPVEAILNIKSDALYNTKTYNLIYMLGVGAAAAGVAARAVLVCMPGIGVPRRRGACSAQCRLPIERMLRLSLQI